MTIDVILINWNIAKNFGFQIIRIKFRRLILIFLKFDPIGKEIAPTTNRDSIQLEEEEMEKFDQWTEELSKEIFIRNDDEETKILSRLNELTDEDFEEE